MGKLMVGVARILPLCALVLVLPALAAAQPTPLTVQRVWTQDAGLTKHVNPSWLFVAFGDEGVPATVSDEAPISLTPVLPHRGCGLYLT
jgi:hypothetical protein